MRWREAVGLCELVGCWRGLQALLQLEEVRAHACCVCWMVVFGVLSYVYAQATQGRHEPAQKYKRW